VLLWIIARQWALAARDRREAVPGAAVDASNARTVRPKGNAAGSRLAQERRRPAARHDRMRNEGCDEQAPAAVMTVRAGEVDLLVDTDQQRPGGGRVLAKPFVMAPVDDRMTMNGEPRFRHIAFGHRTTADVPFKRAAGREGTQRSMNPVARLAYVAVVAVLFIKLIVLVSLQGLGRRRARTFRWPEDAAAFGGALATAGEDIVVERAQAALRNDGESQWLFVVAAGAWVMLGANPMAAVGAFSVYGAARCAHSAWMLRALQPARTRVYGLGLVVMLGIVVDAVRLAMGQLGG
jgi:hypothetical protein